MAIVLTAAQSGQTWIVSKSAKQMQCAVLAGKLAESGVRLLAETDEPGVSMTKIYTFDSIRRKEAVT